MLTKEIHTLPTIESLISLRFIFAIMIFLHHFYVGGERIFPEGFLGVTFFFILSGFVVSLTYEEKIFYKKIKYIPFFMKRFFRLYPLHILCFFIAIIVFYNSLDWKSIIWAIPNLLLLQCWIPIEDCYFSFNFVSWCLSDQIFFYAMFPLIVVFIHKIGKKMAGFLFLIIVVVYSLFAFVMPDKWAHSIYYIFPLSRFLDFIWGIIVYYCYKWIMNKKIITQFSKLEINLIEIFTILILVGFIVCSGHILEIYRYGIYYWFPMSLLVFVFACFNRKDGIISCILTNKILVLLGNVSFSFYMIHMLMMRIVSKILTVSGIDVAWYFRLILYIIIITVLSIWVSKKYEKPLYERLTKKCL